MAAIDLASLLILALCGALASPLGGALLDAFAFEAMDAASLLVALGLLLAAGAGAMSCLTDTELAPQAQSHRHPPSSTIAMGRCLLGIFTLSSLS